jgi:hypothetical protein
MEYNMVHGPPSPKHFTNHLQHVIWPRGFKLEKLNHYDGKVNPELWVQLYETACRSAMGDEHVMANYFPVVVGPVGAPMACQSPREPLRLLVCFASSLCQKLHCYL